MMKAQAMPDQPTGFQRLPPSFSKESAALRPPMRPTTTSHIIAVTPMQTYDDFAHHRRHAYAEDDDDVDEEEGRAAVHPREVGEFPEVAEADCGAGRGDDEADAASE